VVKVAFDNLASGWAKGLGIDRRHFNMFFEKMKEGFAYHKIIVDSSGKPVDYVFLEINTAFEKLTGLQREKVIGKKVTQIIKGIENDPADWLGVYGKVALMGEPVEFENFSVGVGKWFRVSAYCPEKGYFAAIFEDITERRKAAEAIQILNERFEMAQRAAGVGVWDWDVKTGQIKWTREMYRLFGLDPNMVSASFDTWKSILHPEDREEAGAKINEALKTYSFLNNEYRIIRPNGQVIWINALGRGEYDSFNKPVRMTGICVDISERREAEQALAQSEQRWSTTLSSIGDAVIATDLTGKVKFMNRVAEELTGWTLNEASMKPIKDIFHIVNEQTRLEVENPIDRVLKEGVIVGLANHTVLLRKNGTEVPIDDSGAPIRDNNGKITGVVLIFRDITERKKTEEALRVDEEQLRRAIDDAPIPVIMHAEDGQVLQLSRTWTELTGYTINHVPDFNTWLTKAAYGEGANVVRDHMHALFAGHEKSIDLEFPIQTIDGRIRYWNLSASSPGKLRDGRRFIVGMAVDITERKKAEDNLKALNDELEERVQQRTAQVSAERQRLYNVLETLPSYVILLDKDYHVTFANKVFRETFGEDHGRRCHEYLFNKDHECEGCITYNTYRENKPQHWYWTGPNGHNYDIYDFPFKESDGSTLILEMGIDITERIKAEAQALESAKKLRDAERLAAIGATAGMVGHDIRNPLQSIICDLYFAKKDLNKLSPSMEKESIQESLSEIESSVTYINKIVQDLQDYSKPIKLSIQEVNLQSLCNDVLSTINIPSNVEVESFVDESAKKICSDPLIVQRILTNLLNNAIQAMPKGGKLTFRAQMKSNNVTISIADTGAGIPEEIREKLFTPLITTKAKGQGFGLAVVKRMCEALGGIVSFESELGKGTVFTIKLNGNSP
jgi:PAS domain S-box-containing protein